MNNDMHVREWMKDCPYVQDEFARRNGVKKLEYGIYPFRQQPSYHENVLGELVADELQDSIFVLTAEMQYKDGNAQRYTFYQNVIDWIEEQNKAHHFPVLNEGNVKSVSSRVSNYVSEPNMTMERIEIQITLTYKRNN